MNIYEILHMVWINILQNKAKVMLTSLGIIVGAATIVMVIAIGVGGEEEVRENFNGLSAQTIYINVNYAKLQDKDSSNIEKLTIEHMDQIREESTTLSELYLRSSGYEEVAVSNKKEYLSVNGVTDGYSFVSDLVIADGVDLSEKDMEQGANVAVIGDAVAKKLYSSPAQAVGKKIRIKNVTYKVVGVLKRKGDGIQGLQADDAIFIPFQNAKRNIVTNTTINQIIAKAESMDSIQEAIKEMQSTLDYVLKNSSNYLIEDAGSRIEAATKSSRTMKMILIAVAAIVFLVGGIGIMNVLFISVKDRTREIGILKALGMSRHDILLQFLLESIGISFVGGVIGVVISLFLMPLMSYTDIPVVQTVYGPIMALVFSVLTGSLFGWYPAYKASNLKPIEALNYE